MGVDAGEWLLVRAAAIPRRSKIKRGMLASSVRHELELRRSSRERAKENDERREKE